MKNTIITIVVTLVLLVMAFIALVKFKVIEFGHYEGDGHNHKQEVHTPDDGHDHSKDKK